MAGRKGQIPGLYSSEKNVDWSSDNIDQEDQNNVSEMDTSQTQGGKNILNEMRMEKDNLGLNFVHSHRLLEAEISKLQRGNVDFNSCDPNEKLSEKIFVSLKDQKQHNLVGRLLGPKGVTLKRIQAETLTKISILGRGSMRDKKKEEELANGNEPGFEHLKDPLHILVEATPPYSNVKLAAGVAEIKKMLIPLAPGAQDLIVAKFLDPIMAGGNLAVSPGGGYIPREGLLPSPMDGEPGGGYSATGRSGSGRGSVRGRGGAPRGAARGAPARGGAARGGARGRGGTTPTRGARGASRGAVGERGGRGRPRGASSGYGDSGYGGGRDSASAYGSRGDGSGGGPIRTRGTAASSYERMSDYKPETNVGYGSDYDRGYSEREESSYRRSEHGSANDGDAYYSSYSESPSRGYSRDYNHGSGKDVELGGSDWKPRSRGEYRHHPYQQSSSYY